MTLVKTRKELSIIKEQIGCPTDVISLIQYLIELIQMNGKNYGIHHFSDNKVMTWHDFAKHILAENHLLGQVKLVKAENYITFVKRPKNSVL